MEFNLLVKHKTHKMHYLLKATIILLSIVLVLFTIMSYTIKHKTERQSFKVVKAFSTIEIRFYPKAIMASVTSPSGSYTGNSSDNFRKLAGYIFGGNQSSNKIAMTAPVYMEKDANANKMSFVMPAEYSMEQLPVPQDSSIELHYSEEGYFAAIKFGGYANEKTIQQKEKDLKSELAANGIQFNGKFYYLGYNAPWDVVNRENEIIVKINYSENTKSD